MSIPLNVIVNADDIGLSPSVNGAILYAYKAGLITSTSLLTNMPYFDEAVHIIKNNPEVINVGVHANFAEGKPLTKFKSRQFLTPEGTWDVGKTNKVFQLLTAKDKEAFSAELDAQIKRALSANVTITHIDSHLHLHTLPAFYEMFITAAKRYGVKLRLAQTYNEGNYIKFAYRKYINMKIAAAGVNYSTFFETVDEFLKNKNRELGGKKVEIMVHPDFDTEGKLYDHVDGTSIAKWSAYLEAGN